MNNDLIIIIWLDSSQIQDELEFGYIDSPHQQFPVVLDSPRDRGLVDFPYKELLVRSRHAHAWRHNNVFTDISYSVCTVLQ